MASQEDCIEVRLFIPLFIYGSMIQCVLFHSLFANRSLDRLVQETTSSFLPHVATVLPLLVEALPGRIWEGKEALFDVLISLAKHCKSVISFNTPMNPCVSVLHLIFSCVCVCARQSHQKMFSISCEQSL